MANNQGRPVESVSARLVVTQIYRTPLFPSLIKREREALSKLNINQAYFILLFIMSFSIIFRELPGQSQRPLAKNSL